MTQDAGSSALQVKFSFHPTFNVPTLEEDRPDASSDAAVEPIT